MRSAGLDCSRGRVRLAIGGSAVLCLLLAALSVRSGQAPVLPQPAESASPASPLRDAAAPAAPQPVDGRKFDRGTITDAAQLSKLADQLRDELGKLNVNVLSLDVVEKTQQIEKLAKKIKGEAYAQRR